MLTKRFLGIFLKQGICTIELSVFDITQLESIPPRQNPQTAFQHHSAPVAFQESLSASNTVFTMLFTIECTLKMMPQGCRVVKGFKHRDSKILHLICFIAHLTMVISPLFWNTCSSKFCSNSKINHTIQLWLSLFSLERHSINCDFTNFSVKSICLLSLVFDTTTATHFLW